MDPLEVLMVVKARPVFPSETHAAYFQPEAVMYAEGEAAALDEDEDEDEDELELELLELDVTAVVVAALVVV